MSLEVGEMSKSDFSDLTRILKRDLQCDEAGTNDTPTGRYNIIWVGWNRYKDRAVLIAMSDSNEYQKARDSKNNDEFQLRFVFKDYSKNAENDSSVRDEMSKLYG